MYCSNVIKYLCIISRALGVVSIDVVTRKLVSGALTCSDLASEAKVEKYKSVSDFIHVMLADMTLCGVCVCMCRLM